MIISDHHGHGYGLAVAIANVLMVMARLLEMLANKKSKYVRQTC